MSDPGAWSFHYQVELTPSKSDPPRAPEFYQALGAVVVAWGRLEAHFTTTLLIVMNVPGAKAISRQLPVSFTMKVGFWRKAFRTLPELRILRVPALFVVDRMVEAAGDRNAIVHAMWETFVSGDPPTMSMLNIKAKKGTADGLTAGRADISTKTLAEMLKTANALNSSLVPISTHLSKRRPVPPDARKL